MNGAELAGLSDTLTRLSASSARIAALEEALAAEQELRGSLVIEARDQGGSWRTISRAARRSVSRCVAIVGEG